MKDEMKVLEEFGLSKNKSLIYLTLLKLNSSTAEKIAKSSGVHRRNVYDALEGLIRIGLVSYVISDGKKIFKATNPYYLLEILEEEKEKLKIKGSNITSILSKLLQIQGLPKDEDFVTVYKGLSGYKAVLNDILETGKENLVLGVHKPTESVKGFLSAFHKKRIKLRIPEKMIFRTSDLKRAEHLAKLPFTKIKVMSQISDKKVAINIYGDKVAILMWSYPVGILIKKKEIADSFREYFKILWKMKW